MVFPSLYTILLFLGKVIKMLLSFFVSKFGIVTTAMAEMIKKIGITTFIAFASILGFVFTAFIGLIQDGNIVNFILSVAKIFLAAENDIVHYTVALRTATGFWTIFSYYIAILGALFVFIYFTRALVGIIKFLFSDDSKSGMGPILLSLGIIALFEVLFLTVETLTANAGRLSSLTLYNISPFHGLYALLANLGNLVSFSGETSAILTPDEIINQSSGESPRGLFMRTFCYVSGVCS